MKKLLFVTCEYYPYVSAPVNCMQTILDGFKQAGYEITVLTIAYEKGLASVEKRDGITIYRAPVTEYTIVDDALYGEHSALRKLPEQVKTILSYLGYNGIDLFKVRRAVKLFFSKIDEPFDLMLSVVYLPQGHKIAYRIARKRKMKWIMYFLDPYVYNWTIKKYRVGMRKIRERKWARKASAAITSVGIDAENHRHGFEPFAKIRHIELPLPNLIVKQTDVPTEKEKAPGDKIVLRYTGTFYKDIRRPDELLAFLEKLDPERFVAEFYGQGSGVLSGYEHLPACVKLMGQVSVQECRALTDSADILINVGNTCPNQVPSKVFEYIASAKPILNFYSTENDLSLIYLKKYPCILSLRHADDAGEDDLLEIYERGKQLTVQDVRKQYAEYLSENVVRRFIEFAEEV